MNREPSFPSFTPTSGELIKHAAAKYGDKTFVVLEDRRYSFAEVERESRELARAARERRRQGLTRRVAGEQQPRLDHRMARGDAHRLRRRTPQHLFEGARAELHAASLRRPVRPDGRRAPRSRLPRAHGAGSAGDREPDERVDIHRGTPVPALSVDVGRQAGPQLERLGRGSRGSTPIAFRWPCSRRPRRK